MGRAPCPRGPVKGAARAPRKARGARPVARPETRAGCRAGWVRQASGAGRDATLRGEPGRWWREGAPPRERARDREEPIGAAAPLRSRDPAPGPATDTRRIGGRRALRPGRRGAPAARARAGRGAWCRARSRPVSKPYRTPPRDATGTPPASGAARPCGRTSRRARTPPGSGARSRRIRGTRPGPTRGSRCRRRPPAREPSPRTGAS